MIGIVGFVCSKVIFFIVEVLWFYNMIVMGYGVDDVLLFDRMRFLLFFWMNLSIDEFKFVYLLVFKVFNWKYCVILCEVKYLVDMVRFCVEFLIKYGI